LKPGGCTAADCKDIIAAPIATIMVVAVTIRKTATLQALLFEFSMDLDTFTNGQRAPATTKKYVTGRYHNLPY
jgi:hypothetical protein